MIARVAALVVCLGWATGAARAAGDDAGRERDKSNDASNDASADAARDGGEPASDAARPDARAPSPAAPSAAAAQHAVTVPLAARVLEKGTRQAVAGAAIAIDGAVAGETDADGRFETSLAPGAHEVSVAVAGHELERRRIELRTGTKTEAQIFRVLLPASGARFETTVRAARPEIPEVALSAEEARHAPGTGGDPMRVIGLLPGVEQIAWPASLYVVRGANPGNTGFFLDGIRVPELFHLALPRSVIHPYLVEGVDFYPGGGPASYGPYVSGIMAARTLAPPADRVHAAADVTVYDAGGIMTAPWDGARGTVAVAARYSYTGALFSALAIDTILRYGDYQLRVDHPFAGGQATLFAFGSLDEVGWTNPGAAAMEYGALQFHRVDLRWRRAAGGGRLQVAATLGFDRASSTLYASPIKMRGLSAAPRLLYTHSLGARMDLELGASAEAQKFTADVPPFQKKESDLSRSRDALSQAAHATLIARLGDRWVVSPGVRVDSFAEEGTTASFVEPRLDLLCKISDALSLKASGGRFAQMPSLPVSVPGFEAFGLGDFGAQTSLGGAFGGTARLPGQLTLDVTGYLQKLRVTDVRNIDLSNPDPKAPDFLVSRLGRAYGIEVLLRRADVGRFYGWLAYTLSWSQRYDDSGVLGRSDWDERHILNFVSGYRLGDRFTVGAGFHLNTGRWAPIIDGLGAYQQLPTYYQIDLRAERRFVFDRFIMDVYADFENVTYEKEVVQLQAYSQGSVQSQGYQIPLPTVGVHAQF